MSSKKAKELKALALSLSIVNDDLTKKRYFRKSEYYKETDKYLSEVRARNLAALQLAKELEREQPTIAGILNNVLNNAPVEVVGHGDDEEIKEGDIKTTFGPGRKPAERVPGQLAPIVGSTLAEIEKKKLIREEAKGLTDATLKEVIDKLRPIPEEKVDARELDTPAIRQRKAIFEELIERKIARISSETPNNILKLTDEELRSMNKEQINKLLGKYVEARTQELFGETVIPPLSKKAMQRHTKILTKRLDRMEKQQQAEVELQRRARVIAEPTRPEVTTRTTGSTLPPSELSSVTMGGDSAGEDEDEVPPADITSLDIAKKGRPSTASIIKVILSERKKKGWNGDEEAEAQALEKYEKKQKLNKKDYENLPTRILQKIYFKELRKRAKKVLTPEKPAPPTISRAVSAPKIVGQGMQDYMAYMKGKKPTKDMEKLILLIGSKHAGNNSPKLNLQIEKLMHKIKTDLEKKIKAHKSKLAKQELKAVQKEKKKLKIKAEAQRQLELEQQ